MRINSNIFIFIFILFLTSIKDIKCLSSGNYNPKGMDYQLRRPLSYLYKRLQYKLDINPYTSHLVNTQFQCSSKLGPYCSFVNNQRIMDPNIQIPEHLLPLRALLVANAHSNKQIAMNIQKGNLDAFLISSPTHKQYDAVLKPILDPYFYQNASILNKSKNKNKKK